MIIDFLKIQNTQNLASVSSFHSKIQISRNDLSIKFAYI